MKTFNAVAGLALVALLAGACSLLPGSTPDARTEREREIALHASRWAEAGIDSYTFTITRSCFCPPESSGPFTVTVESGVATAVSYEGQAVQPGQVASFPLTIDAVFAALLAAGPDATMTAGWDERGFPVSVSVDPIPNAVDDEYAITIEDFAPAD